MQPVFMSDDEREETIVERRDRERTEGGKVDNDEVIPLLPNVTKDARKIITGLQVWKTNPPNDGYRGTVPVHTDMETIAKRFGNGIYDFHGVTQDSKVLRRVQGVKVEWLNPDATPGDHKPIPHQDSPADKLLAWQASQHKQDAERVESFARLTVDSARENSRQHIDTLAASLREGQERDRNFFSGMMTNQQNFFAAMIQQTQISHQQAMERSREDFRQTIQIMTMSHERATQANDPNLLLGLFREGLALGSGNSEGDDEQEPWTEVFKEGVGAIKDMTEIAKIKAQTASAVFTPSTPPKQIAATTPKTQAKPQQPTKKPLPLTREEITEAIRFKKITEQKGLDFSTLVRQASAHFIGGTDVDQTAPANEAASGASSDAPESAEESESADLD